MYGQGMAQHADRAPPPPRVDAFRNFREEGQMQLGDGAGPTGLAKLYEPPLEVMFKGSFEQVSSRRHLVLEKEWSETRLCGPLC